MGLSSKQVSRDGLGWSQTLLQAQTLELPKPSSMISLAQAQNHQQQSEPLKCPRCDSTNTKFCYYNNYNKSQPRHFCKTCKRHWTKGGTLRNVPVGGGRKNKRLKKSNNSASSTKSTATATTGNNNSRVDTHMAFQCHQPRQNYPITLGDQKNLSDVLYQGLIHPPTSLLQQNPGDLDIKDMSINNVSFISSSPPLPQNHSLPLPNYAVTSSLDTKPLSILTSLQSSNAFKYTGENIEDPSNIINLSLPITNSNAFIQPWQIPAATSRGMDMTSYWNWDEIDTFVSTDLNIPWDDPDVKP